MERKVVVVNCTDASKDCITALVSCTVVIVNGIVVAERKGCAVLTGACNEVVVDMKSIVVELTN